MPTNYVARQGECIASIAYERGFDPEKIWNHPANAKLKLVRQSPFILFEGDQIVIPDREVKELSCATDTCHTFVLKGSTVPFEVVILDEYDQPVTNVHYLLEVEGKTIKQGRTDDQGCVKANIRPNATRGWLRVGEGKDRREYPLQPGYLDPITTDRGVQMRLCNLGFDCGPIDGIVGPRTQAAIADFQSQYDLEVSGKLDDHTREKLQTIYGS